MTAVLLSSSISDVSSYWDVAHPADLAFVSLGLGPHGFAGMLSVFPVPSCLALDFAASRPTDSLVNASFRCGIPMQA